MAWHNVQVIVEVLVEADSPKEARGKALSAVNLALSEGMKGLWYHITKVYWVMMQ